MSSGIRKLISVGIAVFSLSFSTAGYTATPSSLTLFVGQSNNNDLLELVRLKLGVFEPYTILGVNFSKVLFQEFELVNLELAGQLVSYLERSTLAELDALLVFRWKWFPWNSFLPTSVGYGMGASFMSGYPAAESVSQSIFSKNLIHLWVDLRMGLSSLPDWKIDFMIHHRSGGYGLVNGVSGGSNYLCLGLTRIF